MDKKTINERIAELKRELLELETERDNSSGIKPSQTKELINKYHGRCFRFDGVEEGSVELRLESIFINREKKEIKIDGKYIIYCTPDMRCTSLSNNLWIYGGIILCEGAMDIELFPYTHIDWDEPLYEQIDEIFSGSEISSDEFDNDVSNSCEWDDDFGYVTPIDELTKYEEKEIYKFL